MIELARDLVPPKGTPLRAFLEQDILDIRVQARLREVKNLRSARVGAQFKNGAGLQMDSLLREFLVEYNSRAWNMGLDSMPLNFHVLEAFFKHIKPENYFALCSEVDHMFDLPGYLDYYTGKFSNENICERLMKNLPEGTIYSYNVCSSLSDMYFDDASGHQFAIGGLSLIRHDSELSVILLAGERVDIQEQTRKIKKSWANTRVVQKKIGANADPALQKEAAPLLGSESHWRTLIIARIDLRSRVFDERYVLFDCGDHYDVATDRPLYELSPQENRSMREQHERLIPLYDTLFTLMQLPLYFDEQKKSIVIERRQTSLSAERHSTKLRKSRHLLTPLERVTAREVQVIDQAVCASDLSVFLPPQVVIEEAGEWKILRHDQIGRDKHGNIVHGRTWVEKKMIYARPDRLQKLTATRAGEHAWDASPNAGFIYLMRCASHEENIFKIGLTRRDVDKRAKELSTTGVPTEFMTLSRWSVSDCVAAEKEIHAALSGFRVASNREFFRAPPDFLFLTIQGIVAKFRQ